MQAARTAGVGITFRQVAAGLFAVVKVSSGGPSDHRGILPGDFLGFVNGREVKGLSFEDLANLLSGPVGSVVSLAFSRKSAGRTSDLDLQYAVDVERGPPQLSVDLTSATVLEDTNVASTPSHSHTSSEQMQWQSRSRPLMSDDRNVRFSVLLPRTLPGNSYQDSDAFAGTGLVISRSKSPDHLRDYPTIVRVDPASNAAGSGVIQPGDMIEFINGEDMAGKSMADFQQRMKGPPGSLVDVGVLRPSLYVTQAVRPNDVQYRVPNGTSSKVPASRSLDQVQLNGLHMKEARAQRQIIGTQNSGRHHDDGGRKSSTGNSAENAMIAKDGMTHERRKIVRTTNPEQLARQVQIAKIHRLGAHTIWDGMIVWVVHCLVATGIILYLVQIRFLRLDWDLRPFFSEPRVLESQVPSGGFFFPLASIGIVTVMFLVEMCLFAFTVSRMGVTQASLVFAQRPGLLCIMVFGNTFSSASLLLIYFDLSRLECCDFMHNLDFGSLVIMAPIVLGVLLFWAWTLAVHLMSSKDQIQKQIRSECFPLSSAILLIMLSISILIAVLMVFLKIEGYLRNASWITACIPIHSFFGVIFTSSLVSLFQNSVWINPMSRTVLAIIGALDSIIIEAIFVLVMIKLDSPTLDIGGWDYATFVFALFMPVYTFFILLYDVSVALKWTDSKSARLPEKHWLQAHVLEFYSSRASKISAEICWASPAILQKSLKSLEYSIQIADAGSVDDAPSTIISSEKESKILQGPLLRWKEVSKTKEHSAKLSHLKPAHRYMVRVLLIPAQGSDVSGPPLNLETVNVLIETPNWPMADPEDIQERERGAGALSISQMSQTNGTSAAGMVHAAVKSIPLLRPPVTEGGYFSPLFLKELKADGRDNLFYAVFCWIPQTHFDANILDLKLDVAGNFNEQHDYVVIFAGPENQVRVHNILAGASYRARLRASDLLEDDISAYTAVERATLSFRTPTWQEVLDRNDFKADFAALAVSQAKMAQSAWSVRKVPQVLPAKYPVAGRKSTVTNIPLRPLQPVEPSTDFSQIP